MSGKNDSPPASQPKAEVPRYISFGGNKKFVPQKSEDHVEEHFCSNYVSTKMYTAWNFLPLNLFQQLRKKANFYFLIIACLSLTPYSPKSAAVSIAPLVIVLSITAIKEALEDRQRYKMDQEMNHRQVEVWRHANPEEGQDTAGFVEVNWKDVVVGDTVRITNQASAFPADILLLQSSSPKGMVNIETSNLDGETNLKIKQAVAVTYNLDQHAPDGTDYPLLCGGQVESSQPSVKMDKSSWRGNLVGFNGDQETVSLSMNCFCLRGCTLRNTDWMIGVVLFTGSDTKLMLNNKGAKFKRSNVDRTVDTLLYWIFAMQAVCCLTGSIAGVAWQGQNATKDWYLGYSKEPTSEFNPDPATDPGFLSWLFMYFTWLVLVDLFVPISLYVSMEVVKFAQAWLINQDITMYHMSSDTPARARTSNLNEELGQISFIFSDKTGTLTRNMMEFLNCSVDGKKYGPGEMAAQNDFSDRAQMPQGMPDYDKDFRFEDNRLIRDLELANEQAGSKHIDDFLTLLAVCHTIIPEYPQLPNGEPGEVEYQASSPDEKALTIAAKNLQYFFTDRRAEVLNFHGEQIEGQVVTVNIRGQELDFEVFEILEFNSTRKRMSVIVKDPRDNKLKLFCKGADNVIFERMTQESRDACWAETEEHLVDFARVGLRTLCCAVRVIEDDEFVDWWQHHKAAKSDMANRDALVAKSYETVESNLELCGSTAIEDRLQDGVPDTIANLAKAGVKIWVLTGDKTETAINIGRSAKLLTPGMQEATDHLIVIDISESIPDDEARQQTEDALKDAWELVKDKPDGSADMGFVISGRALGFVFPFRKLDKKGKDIPPTKEQAADEHRKQDELLRVAVRCAAVICCRVSPKQKAQIVELVRFNVAGQITLAIGDGANDVPMIKAAHVGIGISGQEGLQAVMASDYAIAQFRFLERLMLVHGGWSYRRISKLILYSFYKNITISLTQVWFGFQSAFSGQMYYDAFTGSAFNMAFTLFPVILAAVFDRDMSPEHAVKYPELYAETKNNKFFNVPRFFKYMAQGCYHSLIIYFFSQYSMSLAATFSNGHDNDLWTASTAMYNMLVWVVNCKMMLETRTWNKWTGYSYGATMLVWHLWLLAYSGGGCNWLGVADMYWVGIRMLEMAPLWFATFAAVIFCLVPEVIYKYMSRMYSPTLLDVVQERENGHGQDESGDPPGKVGFNKNPESKEHVKVDISQKKIVRRRSGSKSEGRQFNHGYAAFQEDSSGPMCVMGQNEFSKIMSLKASASRGNSRANSKPPSPRGSISKKSDPANQRG